MYNTHEHMTISRALAETPLTYSVMRTRVSRLSRKPHSSAPDVEYDVRAGKYKPLAETARESGLKYTSMTVSRSQAGGQA